MIESRRPIWAVHHKIRDVAHSLVAVRQQIINMGPINPPLQPFSFQTVLLLAVLVPPCAYLIDVVILRPVVDYFASIGPQALAPAAPWVVPIALVIFELWLGVNIVKSRIERGWPSDADTKYAQNGLPSKGLHIPTQLLLSMAVILLFLQPAAATATYLALDRANPAAHASNVCLFVFLVVAGLIGHMAVIACGSQYLALLETVRARRRQATMARLQAQVQSMQHTLLTLYSEFINLVNDYRVHHPDDPFNPPFDPITLNELRRLLPPNDLPPPTPPSPQPPPPTPPGPYPYYPDPDDPNNNPNPDPDDN